MKRIQLLFSSLAFCMPAVSGTCIEYAQELGVPTKDPSTGSITYQAIVQVEGVTASQLYSSAKATITNLYTSPKDIVQLDDKDGGRIVVKGIYEIEVDVLGTIIDYVSHTLTIEVKDGRYRVTVSGLVIESVPSTSNTIEVPGFTESFGATITNSSCFGKKTQLKNTHQGAVSLLESAKSGMETNLRNDEW